MASASRVVKRLTPFIQQVRQYSAPGDRSIPAAKQKYVPTSGSYPKGFQAGSAFAGVKASNTKYDDVALVISDKPCSAAAVFTQNVFQAAPVTVSKQILSQRQSENIRGVVVNSGCANAVTGRVGLEHATLMAAEVDKLFTESQSSSATEVPQTLVMSTGVIGQRLPIDRITGAIPKLQNTLGSTHDDWLKTAQAICTTDTFPKLISRTFTLPSQPDTTYTIAGMTKGAGMIHPNMATLLGIVCTDVQIDPPTLKTFLSTANALSFNSITVDGDTSTNDTVVLLANGAASPPTSPPLGLSPNSPDHTAFQTILTTFMRDLAQLVVRDGEGATKFVTIKVRIDPASTSSSPSAALATAKRIANSIAQSALVKTALYGRDANWGRILCAVGYAPGVMESDSVPVSALQDGDESVRVVPSKTSVSFVPADGSEELKLLVRGEPEKVDEVRAKEILDMEDLEIVVRLEDDGGESGEGVVEAVVWTCDFSHEYVTINGDYRT